MPATRSREAVLQKLLDSSGPVDAGTIAEALGIHVTTARFHLNNLIDAGLASSVALPPVSVGRPRMGYVGVRDAPTGELVALLLTQLGTTVDVREQRAADAGHLWAARHPAPPTDAQLPDPVTAVSDALAELGFTISSTTSAFGAHELHICSCPLAQFADGVPEIARGVIRGVIEESLAAASPALASSYCVVVTPDTAHGDCSVTVRLNEQRRAPAPVTHAT